MITSQLTDFFTVGAVGLLAIWNVISSNRRDKRDDIVTENNAMQIMRTSMNTYRDETDKLRTEVHEMSKQLEKMKGIIEEKDKQLAMFERIFQNRNPEIETFIKSSTVAISSFQEYIKRNENRMELILESIQSLLKKGNE
jgi:predicted RNase H-like nuclease (RuvC/YqgF family)